MKTRPPGEITTPTEHLMLWRFRGTPHYLGQQAIRLGVTPVLADRARNNQEIYRVSVLLSQLCERYHKARKEDGRPMLALTEIAQVRGTLQQAEQECAKLHALAATAAAMIDEAYEAFGTEQVKRPFEVLSDYDTPKIPLPLGDGTVGSPDESADRPSLILAGQIGDDRS
jgi:hypothetical protein